MKNLVLLLTAVVFVVGTAVTALAGWQTPVQLTSNATSDYSPSINSDGTKIAYHGYDGSDYEIYFVEYTGGAWQAPVQLTSNATYDYSPSINSDGTKIAYYGYDGSDDEIYFVEDIQPAAIPTLSEWGMIIMALLLAASAIWMVRRKTARGMGA